MANDTLKAALLAIGQSAIYTGQKIPASVVILDARAAWGRTDVKVRDVSGGECWVDWQSCCVETAAAK